MAKSNLFQQALEFEKSQDFQQAEIIYLRLLEEDPSDARAYLNLGTIYNIQNKPKKAIAFYKKALGVSPKFPIAHYNLANVYHDSPKTKETVKLAKYHYLLAIESEPTYTDPHYNLAVLFLENNEPRKALSQWRKYLKLDSAGDWHERAKAEIKNILKYDPLRLVFFNRNPKRTNRRAKLCLVS